MNWQQWKETNKHKIAHIVGYEEKFVDEILSQIPQITPDDVFAQYSFRDRKSSQRYIDFMILNEKKGYQLPIELDGYTKINNKGYAVFNDFLERQNDLIQQFGIVLRYTNKKAFTNQKEVINEIQHALTKQSKQQITELDKQKQVKKLIEEFEAKIKEYERREKEYEKAQEMAQKQAEEIAKSARQKIEEKEANIDQLQTSTPKKEPSNITDQSATKADPIKEKNELPVTLSDDFSPTPPHQINSDLNNKNHNLQQSYNSVENSNALDNENQNTNHNISENFNNLNAQIKNDSANNINVHNQNESNYQTTVQVLNSVSFSKEELDNQRLPAIDIESMKLSLEFFKKGHEKELELLQKELSYIKGNQEKELGSVKNNLKRLYLTIASFVVITIILAVGFTLPSFWSSMKQTATLSDLAIIDSSSNSPTTAKEVISTAPPKMSTVVPATASESTTPISNRYEIAPSQTAQYVGEYKTICGTIVEYHPFSKGVFFNFSEKFPKSPLTVVIWDENPQLQSTLKSYLYKPICIKGKIEAYKNTPRITVRYADQILAQ